MTKQKNSSKLLKSAMIGTVALTPILAVGVNVDQAKAATKHADVDQLIINLKTAFNGLTPKQQSELVAAKGNVDTVLNKEGNMPKYLELLLKDPTNKSAEEVVTALVTLLANSYSADSIEESFNKFDELTDEDLDKAFGTKGLKKTDFVNFLVYVQSGVFEKLGTTQNYSSYYEVFEDVLFSISDNKNHREVAKAIVNAVKVENVKEVLKSIVDEAKITTAQEAAFVALAEKYKAAITPGTPPGGGGVVIPPTPPVVTDGAVETDGSTIEGNPQSVIDAINGAKTIDELIIKVQEGVTKVGIPATILNALDKKNSKAVIVLKFGDVSYELPVSTFDLDGAAKDLDVTSAELKLNVSVEKVDNPLKDKATYKVLAEAYDFNLALEAPGGKSQVLKVFPTPIKRSLPTASTLNPLTTVGVTVDANGKVTAVPTFVSGDKSANLYRSTNSVYTLIEYSKSFTDLTGGTSWAGEYVDKLASRMVVNGKTDTTFAPTLKITRGEFAAILSRGLGIVAMDPTASSFKDVSTSQAFNQNGEISAVVEAGIVSGYTHDTFRPYEEITRDQAAIMISRAIDYVGADKVTFDKNKALTAFKDNKQIGAASRTHVERVYQAGLLDGYLDDTFRPTADANRAQMAKIIYNFLAEIEFIN